MTSLLVGGRQDLDGRTKARAVEIMLAIVVTPREKTSVGGLICCF